MKKILLPVVISSLIWTSCSEVPIILDTTERGFDTTYVGSVESPQQKMILVEELSGVECVNCPAGAQMLEDANESGPAAGRLIITTIHAGDLTKPLNKEGKVSDFDFRTDVGLQIITTILGGDIGKPCASFDRLPLSSQVPGGLLDYQNKWASMIEEALATHSATPVNVSITTNKIDNQNYKVSVKVSYTQAVTGNHALTVYLTESGIEDYQMFPAETKKYEFNHTFRGLLTPFNGMTFLNDVPNKEAGRVFIQEFNLEIEDGSNWNPEHMHVVAFVHNTDAEDKTVFQAAQVDLND